MEDSNMAELETQKLNSGEQKDPVKKKTHFGQSDKSSKFAKWIKHPENLQVTLTVLAVVLGTIFGFVFKLTVSPGYRAIYLISYPGELLMNMLKMLIIPLIVSSLISGLAALDPRSSGKVGSCALIYYFTTTFMAVILGIILVVSIHPGRPNIKKDLGEGTTQDRKSPDTLDAFLDLFRNIVPPNIVQACTQQYVSIYVNKTKQPQFAKTNLSQDGNETAANNSSPARLSYETIEPQWSDHTNVLGLVTFSIAFGLVVGQMGDKAALMIQFFTLLNEIVMRLVGIIMWYSPVGIFFLIMGKILGIDDLSATAHSLGLYMVTVILGLVIHSVGTLSILFYVITRRNPAKFFKGCFQAWITALGTASSAATLPVTFRCLEENNHIDHRVTRFVLPIGATINMDGTALYEAVASIFIAQINSIPLGFGKILTISITATLAAIGAASVPSAGLVTMVLVLTSAGLPVNDISLILAVDWMLDRLRTSINVLGDAFGAGIVEHLCRDELAKQDVLASRRFSKGVLEAVNPPKRRSLDDDPADEMVTDSKL